MKHDDFYSQAHTMGEYFGAHFELARCVSEVSPVMAGIMFIGVVVATAFIGLKKLPAWYWNRT